MLSIAVLVGLAFGALLWWVLRSYNKLKMLEKIPGMEPVLPLLGNTLHLKSDALGTFNQIVDLCEKHSRDSSMIKLVVGSTPMVFVYRAEVAEHVLKAMKNLTKSLPYRYLEPWLGTGLLTSTGAKWQSRRKLLTPTFHFKILNDFMNVFNEQSRVLVEVLEAKCGKDAFDAFPYITMCALDIICETAMGKKMNAQKLGEQSEYVNALFRLSDLITIRSRSPWQWNNFLYGLTDYGRRHETYLKTLHGFTQKVIADRKKEMHENPEGEEQGGKKKRAFLDLLLHMAKEAGFTDQDIQEEVDTFMFEGHDTTAAGMAWTIQLIGSHPDVQKKLHEELDEVFGDSDRPATPEDLTKLKYLECVIKESLRVCPPVPLVGRTVEEDTEVDGVTIPEGASLSIFVWKINRDPEYFKDPEKFDPERFRPENSVGRHPYTFIPFSAGPRNCIGQRFALNEEKVVLSTILRNFSITSMERTEDIRPIPEIILRPSKVSIKLTKR